MDNSGLEYPERRGRRVGIVVDGFGLADGFVLPVVENIERVDIVTSK